MVPLTVGFLAAAPISGILSDRFGARPFATGGMVLAAGSFALLDLLPVNFSYIWFALILVINGVGMGLFASPNRAGIMNSLPPNQRGVGAGMTATFQNSATVLSIGIFFSLLILGLSATLPAQLYQGLIGQGVPAAAAHQVAALPPVGTLFAALLGYNPIQSLLGPQVLGALPSGNAATLTSRSFFPDLISGPFQHGLQLAFIFAIAACLVAAVASYLRAASTTTSRARSSVARPSQESPSRQRPRQHQGNRSLRSAAPQFPRAIQASRKVDPHRAGAGGATAAGVISGCSAGQGRGRRYRWRCAE